MRRAAVLEHEHQLVLRPIERAHAAIVFVPDAERLQFGVCTAAGGEQLETMPPIHADEVNRSVGAVPDQAPENLFQERGELSLGHFARRHRELAMTYAT